MKGLFALVVFAMTLAVAQSGSVTWGGAYNHGSLVQAVATTKFGVWFTPTVTVPAAGKVTITASEAIFSAARRAAATMLCYSDNVAQTCTATQTTTVLTVTLAATKSLTAGKVAYVEMQDEVPVNPNASTVTFSIKTTEDTTALTGQTGYTIVGTAANLKKLMNPTMTFGTVPGVPSLKNGAARGDIIWTFSPTTAVPGTGTIVLTSAAGTVYTANADDTTTTVCAVKQFDPKTATMKAVTVTKTVTTSNRIATVTMGAILYPNLPVSVICDGSKNVAVLGTDEAYVLTMASSTDAQATAATTLTSDSGVTWASAARTTLTTGAAGGDLVVKFTPTTALAQNDLITITASEAIFAAAAAITGVTVTANNPSAALALIEDTNTKTVETAANTILGTAKMINQIILKVNAAATAHEITITVPSAKMAANGATAGAVTFSIGTTTDPGNLVGQTGYTLVAPVASSSAANSTATASASAATSSNPHTTVTQAYTFPSITAAQYTLNTKGNMECAYANNVEAATTPTWCVATAGSRAYKAGIVMSSSAARRAATVTFVLKVDTSVLAKSALETKVATSATAAKFAAALAKVNTGTGFNITDPGTATNVATATFTSTGSGASSLLPSMLGLVSALFIAFKHM